MEAGLVVPPIRSQLMWFLVCLGSEAGIAAFFVPPPWETDQIGSSIDLASWVKSFGPASVMCQQSSSRMPNSPGM